MGLSFTWAFARIMPAPSFILPAHNFPAYRLPKYLPAPSFTTHGKDRMAMYNVPLTSSENLL
jgi:hypothetical protein